MKKEIKYDCSEQRVTLTGGTKENPMTGSDLTDFLSKDPHYLLDNFKRNKPEVYRHLVALIQILSQNVEKTVGPVTIGISRDKMV